MSDDPAIAEFFNGWELYRAIIDGNCMEHREVGAAITPVLAERTSPFTILDLGCGDAALLAPVLPDLPLARYIGVDIAQGALDAARALLAPVRDRVELRQADLMAPLADAETFDVILISFALHHFDAAGKRAFLAAARDRLRPGGDLLLIDVVRTDGQSRDDYLDFYDDYVHTWPVSADLAGRIITHVRRNDWPEEVSTLPQWATAAGFDTVTQLYRGGQHTQAAWRLHRTS